MKNSVPENVSLETCACPLGCESDDQVVLKGRDRLHDLPGEYTVVQCQICGLMRTNPRPTPETMGFYYPDNYGPYQATQVSPKKATTISLFIAKLISLLPTNIQALPKQNVGSMLEVGCASGRFLHKMKQDGWRVQGIEFSDSAASAARDSGYSVVTGQVETAADYEEPFDLVVGWMVVEHLHHPVAALKKLHKWTKPDGYLVISVPNAGSAEFEIFKDDWYALQLPGHLSHFTPDSLSKILREAGWSVEKVLHQRNLVNLMMSTKYRLERRWPNSYFTKAVGFLCKFQRYINFLLFPLAWIMSCFGQTGRMTVWAKRIDSR